MSEPEAPRKPARWVLPAASALIAFLAVVATVTTALVASDDSDRTSRDTQWNTAFQGVGGSTAAERAGGVNLARAIAVDKLGEADRPGWFRRLFARDQEVRDDAVATYRAALRMTEMSITLAAPNPDPSVSTTCAPTPPARESIYDAAELKALLDQRDVVTRLAPGRAPTLDLGGANLCGVSWAGLDADWLDGPNMAGVDLRSANLSCSAWGRRASLRGARLDGANLAGARFDGADLTGATLNDANVEGAELGTARVVPGTVVTGTRGTPRSWPPGVARTDARPDDRPGTACGR